MKKKYAIIAVLISIPILIYLFIYLFGEDKLKNEVPKPLPTGKENLIVVDSPIPNQIINSPVVITGKARGNWFFEASFPIEIVDGNGKQLGIVPAQAIGEWMTEEFVSFKATLTFTTPNTETGKIILRKDNPSGMSEFDDKLEIPIRFDTSKNSNSTNPDSTIVGLYYYNQAKDYDASGNITCTEQGLVKVERKVERTITPIQDTLKLLLKGELTNAEKQAGITTEYPLQGLELTGASLKSGVLTLSMKDPNSKTTGGSCRVNILRAQIEKTAKQFPEVTSVRFIPEDSLFQP